MTEDIIQGCRNLKGKTFKQLLQNEAEEMLDVISVPCSINTSTVFNLINSALYYCPKS